MRRLKELINYYIKTPPKLMTEMLYGRKWDDCRRGIEWMNSIPSVMPGGMAVGYNYMYVMTRILNEMKPKSILDIGLGISSTLFSHYMDSFPEIDGKHIIIENNAEWISFYATNRSLSQNSTILMMDLYKAEFHGEMYNAYREFEKKLAGERFSLISIDGPLAGDRNYKHARRDVLEILPNALEDSFVLVMDDANRKGERATIAEIQKLLLDNGIPFHTGYYDGETMCCVIASEDNRFFCTL